MTNPFVYALVDPLEPGQGIKAAWADPEVRERMRAGLRAAWARRRAAKEEALCPS